MAVAYKDKAFGSAESNMKIADPVVISTAMPRFLSPKDTISVPITLTNTTDKNASAAIKIKTEGPIKIIGSNNDNISLNANQENRSEFKLLATNNIGPAKLSVSVNALGETFENITELPVRPASSLQKRSGSGSVVAGQSETLNLATDFIKCSMDGELYISRSPLAEFSDDLQYLVRYPYGCVEQTIASAFPQIYYYEMTKACLLYTSDAADES